MFVPIWLLIVLSGFGCWGTLIFINAIRNRKSKVVSPSTSTNSKSTQCTCDYDGDKNKVVVYCGKCGGIVE